MKKTLLLVASAVMACTSALGQWNSNNAENILAWPEDRSYYSEEMEMTPDGGVWIAVAHPRNGAQASIGLQLIDSLGNYKFEEPLLVSDYPARTWISCGQILFVDRDGNAIVSVVDFRYAPNGVDYENHTVYKISPEGEFLWGEDGITLEGENVYDLVAGMSMCQLSDGSYVFAWMHNREENRNMMSIEMQRVSPEGEMLWKAEDVRLHDEKITYQCPYVVDGGNNQVVLLYAKGSSQDLMARKLDFDGTPVWSEDTKVYNGGWGSIPIWTLLDVHPSGDGGLIVSWNDDRNYTNVESAYMAYVKPNGELGFSAENGQILGLAGWRSLKVRCFYDKASDAFYATWVEASQGQSWNRLVAQKISKDGELLWGENALELKPMEQTNYAYNSIQSSVDGEVAFFYMRNYSGSFGDVEAFVTTVNANDTTIRRESEFTKGERVSQKAGLETTPLYDNKYWIVMWNDNGATYEEVKVDRMMLQRLNVDFSLGSAGVEAVRAESTNFEALATLVDGEAMFATNMG
ncbi:MAG: hypothetical protein J6U43_01605, partial [Bacteroidales bacterium]|nr:hypothetical protein [Bacteroidales bacterium]